MFAAALGAGGGWPSGDVDHGLTGSVCTVQERGRPWTGPGYCTVQLWTWRGWPIAPLAPRIKGDLPGIAEGAWRIKDR